MSSIKRKISELAAAVEAAEEQLKSIKAQLQAALDADSDSSTDSDSDSDSDSDTRPPTKKRKPARKPAPRRLNLCTHADVGKAIMDKLGSGMDAFTHTIKYKHGTKDSLVLRGKTLTVTTKASSLYSTLRHGTFSCNTDPLADWFERRALPRMLIDSRWRELFGKLHRSCLPPPEGLHAGDLVTVVSFDMSRFPQCFETKPFESLWTPGDHPSTWVDIVFITQALETREHLHSIGYMRPCIVGPGNAVKQFTGSLPPTAKPVDPRVAELALRTACRGHLEITGDLPPCMHNRNDDDDDEDEDEDDEDEPAGDLGGPFNHQHMAADKHSRRFAIGGLPSDNFYVWIHRGLANTLVDVRAYPAGFGRFVRLLKAFDPDELYLDQWVSQWIADDLPLPPLTGYHTTGCTAETMHANARRAVTSSVRQPPMDCDSSSHSVSFWETRLTKMMREATGKSTHVVRFCDRDVGTALVGVARTLNMYEVATIEPFTMGSHAVSDDEDESSEADAEYTVVVAKAKAPLPGLQLELELDGAEAISSARRLDGSNVDIGDAYDECLQVEMEDLPGEISYEEGDVVELFQYIVSKVRVHVETGRLAWVELRANAAGIEGILEGIEDDAPPGREVLQTLADTMIEHVQLTPASDDDNLQELLAGERPVGATLDDDDSDTDSDDDDETLEMTTIDYVVHCLLGRIPELRPTVLKLTKMMPWCNGDDLSDLFKLFCGNQQYGRAFLKLHEHLDKITVDHWKCTDVGVKVRMPMSWDDWVPAFKAIEPTEATLVIAGGADGGFVDHWDSHCIVTECRTQYFGDLQRRLTEGQCFVPFHEGRLPPLSHVAIVHAFTGAFVEADERTSLTRWRQSKTPMAGMAAHPHWAGPLHCFSNAFEGEHPIAILQRKFRARRQRTDGCVADMFDRRCTIAQRRGKPPMSIVIPEAQVVC